ncbi:hypothetical protein BDV41DRAFT_556311 [Aspergillus transmontanensis]|uniref:Uncharacterized protein n=1 Tax=Aspergillus transmontanensis TaxID=1034304 RepID=A0A5N6VEX3_9EURO|nr:hypothetical protein BDV41DRAFT_556311 [Aspergillus transmontanensis]
MSLGLRTGLLGLSDKPSLLYLLIFLTLIPFPDLLFSFRSPRDTFYQGRLPHMICAV